MDKRNNDFDFDFTPIGQAIKKAREATGMTREQLARIVDYTQDICKRLRTRGSTQASSCLFSLLRCSCGALPSSLEYRQSAA